MNILTLKKVTIGNPLFNLGMHEEVAVYNSIDNDEDLVAFYHYLLSLADRREKEGRHHSILRQFTYSMIAFSTGRTFNVDQLFN